MSSTRRVLVVFPTEWDARQLRACRARWQDGYRVELAEPTDAGCPWDLDVPRLIRELVARHRGRIDGVFSSSDYPGATSAGAIATALGLPGSRPEALLRAAHKWYSRIAQREAAPEATPGFDLVPLAPPLGPDPSVGYPCFVKPVRAAFSLFARPIADRAALEAYLERPALREFANDYLHIFNTLVRELSPLERDGSYVIAEQLLHGDQVTVEGWCRGGEVAVLGIVDSIVHPETRSFVRFDYPSALPAAVQERMAGIAARVVRGLGLTDTMFNIEMFHDAASGRVSIIEVNPRLCGQFADLYQKVDGFNGYEVALALAAGDRPPAGRRAGPYPAASSFPLRVFRPVRVTRAPTDADLAAAEQLHPGTQVWSECREGQVLRDFETAEDGASCRYAVVNVGGAGRADIDARLAAVRDRLGYVLDPL